MIVVKVPGKSLESPFLSNSCFLLWGCVNLNAISRPSREPQQGSLLQPWIEICCQSFVVKGRHHHPAQDERDRKTHRERQSEKYKTEIQIKRGTLGEIEREMETHRERVTERERDTERQKVRQIYRQRESVTEERFIFKSGSGG